MNARSGAEVEKFFVAPNEPVTVRVHRSMTGTMHRFRRRAPDRLAPRRLVALAAWTALAGCTGEGRSPTTCPLTLAAALTPSKMDDLSSAPSTAPADPPVKLSEPAYELAADRERRARVAKEELGPQTITTIVSDIFVVIGAPGWAGAGLARSVALLRSAMGGYMNSRFGRKPAQAISVYLFPEGTTYESFCKKKYGAPCIAHYGFYQPDDRYMVMNIGLGLGTLTHEIVHPLVETDFPAAPTWLNEGIASLFEAPVIPKAGEIHGVKNWRHPRLKRALLSPVDREDARLDVMFTMRDELFRSANEDLHYAMARYVCQWLDECGKLWAFYQRWRDTVATDPPGATAFQQVGGMTPAAASPVWSRWTLTL